MSGSDKAAAGGVPLSEIERAMPLNRTSLAEQIAEVEREVRQRCRIYPRWVAEGTYKLETAARKLAAIRHAHDTLAWLEANMDWIKPEAERRTRERRLAAEADALRSEPAVAEVMAEFPGAEIAAVREINSEETAA